MRRGILFLFYVIFFLNNCGFQKTGTILEGIPDSVNRIYFANDSITEWNAWAAGDLGNFYSGHGELFSEGHAILGKTNRLEPLLIQQCKSDIYQKWLEGKDFQKLEFQDWEIYKLNTTTGAPDKSLHLSYHGGFIFVSPAGYLVEEALLGMEGGIRNLMEMLPGIKRLEEGETYQRIKDLPVMESVEAEGGWNSFFEQKIIGKIKKNDTLYFQGEIIDSDIHELSKDAFSEKILSFIPKDISYAGIYTNQKYDSELINELSPDSGFNYSTFSLINELGEDYPFLMISLEKEDSGLLGRLGKKYGILEENNDYFLPIIRMNMNGICEELKELSYVPCFSNPYVFMMDKYLIFAKSLNSVDTYLEGFALNHSFKNNTLLNHVLSDTNSLGGDLHYFKPDIQNASLEQEMILSLKPSGEKGINDLSCYVVRTEKKERAIKKMSTYSVGNNITSDVFVLSNKSGDNYFVFQDSSNTVYFINQHNKLLHSMMLDEKIISEIYHFKDYETDNDRYVFNTKSKIYILGPKGGNLHDFPMKLSSPASNGIGLINIENTFSTYAFLACENGNFYGYDLGKGLKPMPSWNPLINTGAIQNKMTFLEGETETHYAYINKDRKLISLNRKTESRFNAVPIGEEFGMGIQVDNAVKGKERFVFHDGKGKLKIINTKGESFFLPLNNGKEKGIFLLMNIRGTEEKEYVFLSEGKITIHGYENAKFEKILEFRNIHNIDKIFEVSINKSHSLLGGLDSSGNKIYLFRNNGELVDGFPLEGDKEFKVFPVNKERYLIVTAFENKLINYMHSHTAFMRKIN